MDTLVNVLPENGSMSFPEYVQAVRNAGGNASLWLRAKHQGLIETFLQDGTLYVRRGVSNG